MTISVSLQFPLSEFATKLQQKTKMTKTFSVFVFTNQDYFFKNQERLKTMEKDIKCVLVTNEQINELCDRIAAQITEDYKNSDKKLVLVCILKGSLMFTSELMKRIKLPLEVEFMKASSYGSKTVSSGIINIHLDIIAGWRNLLSHGR